MDLKEIRQLIKIVEKSGISEFEMEEEGKKLKITKNSDSNPVYVKQNPPAEVHQIMPQTATSVPGGTPEPHVPAPSTPTEESASSNIVEVRSPMVGTFYRSPAPDADSYIQIGNHIEVGQVLCIIEAMKLMNEIESEVAGKVVKILVENAQPVEYNQVMFHIESP
jgi:acetyl-CoA carboxylase biotin carboxyl carrier protein